MSFSPFHQWFTVLVMLAIWAPVVWAAGTILNRAGYSRWWSVLAVVPIANWIALMVFASSDWPTLRRGPDSEA